MLHGLPDVVDPWRFVARGQRLSGQLKIAELDRLKRSVSAEKGHIAVELVFGKTELGTPCVTLSMHGQVALECRRTMAPFQHELEVHNSLALAADEASAQALESEMDVHVVAPEGLRLHDLVEDELILALPIMPLSPAARADEKPVIFATGSEPEQEELSPFAVLKSLREASEQEIEE